MDNVINYLRHLFDEKNLSVLRDIETLCLTQMNYSSLSKKSDYYMKHITRIDQSCTIYPELTNHVTYIQYRPIM